MISFINYLLMIEAKVDDLVAKHPEHEEAIRAYHAADPSPTKKFLPWLVKQHMAGNVTPNDVRLGSTLQHFDKVKHQLDNKDHSGYHYNDLANTVGDRVKSKLEADAKKNSVETIHKEPSGITAQHIKTKEASQDLYGGGEHRGGKKGCARGTNWCVSARSEKNMFHSYGPMYTIHDSHDENAPYAVHPFNNNGTITSRHNDGDEPYKEVVNNNPRISKAVNKIMQHASRHVGEMLSHEDHKVRAKALQSPIVSSEHLHKALSDPHFSVREAAAGHPSATAEHVGKALEDKDEYVRRLAAMHPSATEDHINKALGDKNELVRMAALHNPNSTPKHLIKGFDDNHPGVQKLALQIGKHRGWIK